ncbi:MAG: hypothetical protein Q4G25_00960 [Paracoccus sp. (in: a-proteobacteria)]|nr:hypothetical protein [Paracoccus sp. (in: a-proteobacteria)]
MTLTRVTVQSGEPERLSENLIIRHHPRGGAARDITQGAHDHRVPSDARMQPSALVAGGGRLVSGGGYRDLHSTGDACGPGTVTIKDRAEAICNGSDGAHCHLRTPLLRVEIR